MLIPVIPISARLMMSWNLMVSIRLRGWWALAL